jgi:gliding motility-associated-like protein
VDGSLTITTAALVITADNQTKIYGSANPTLTASYSGFVNGDTQASLTTPPTISTTAIDGSPVGSYPIKASGAIGTNYTISYIPGILTITPSSSVDVDLTSLSVSNGVLNPAFSPNIVSYSVTVANNIDTETITVTSDDPLASITVNGTVVLNGSSTEVPLVVGNNPIVVIVTSQDGSVTKNYTVNVTRESSNNATLTNLAISEGTLKPSFESNITNYSTTVKYDINSITVTPTVTDPTATITVNELAVANNTASAPIILKPGQNSIETVVTAQDGITKQTYTILVYKGVSPESLVINNIISPNGDGKNDFWEIQDIQLFPNNKVTVFDRAGRIVYSKNGYGNEWDGSYEGSPLNYDTYYYLIDLGDDIPKIKGFITMLKN